MCLIEGLIGVIMVVFIIVLLLTASIEKIKKEINDTTSKTKMD